VDPGDFDARTDIEHFNGNPLSVEADGRDLDRVFNRSARRHCSPHAQLDR